MTFINIPTFDYIYSFDSEYEYNKQLQMCTEKQQQCIHVYITDCVQWIGYE